MAAGHRLNSTWGLQLKGASSLADVGMLLCCDLHHSGQGSLHLCHMASTWETLSHDVHVIEMLTGQPSARPTAMGLLFPFKRLSQVPSDLLTHLYTSGGVIASNHRIQ